MPPETERRRDAARSASNRLFLKISGRSMRAYSIVKHVGRRTGREYVNPVSAYPSRNGFVITILYGLDSQWVRNVLAAGRLTLVTRGREHVLDRPGLIPKAEALSAYPPWQRWMLKTRGVEDFLWAHEQGSGEPQRSPPS